MRIKRKKIKRETIFFIIEPAADSIILSRWGARKYVAWVLLDKKV